MDSSRKLESNLTEREFMKTKKVSIQFNATVPADVTHKMLRDGLKTWGISPTGDWPQGMICGDTITSIQVNDVEKK